MISKMFNSFFRQVSALALAGLSSVAAWAAVPAFPGAEGFGAVATGGRGGKVYHVTNLSDDGKAGSLRYAVNQSGARTIVFDVSGIIELNSALSISKGDITIAGQTAPGDGICIKNYNVYVNADNVVIRFLRFRMGTDKPDGYNADGTPYLDRDAIWGRSRSNIIIDHCSMSWCTDECASFYGNKNFTMQWCLIAESLRGSFHPKGYHGYGGIWGGQGASFHHNLLAHHDSRNPRLCGSRYTNQPDLELVDLRNNVFYNWGSTNSGYAGEGGNYNFINNYYKSGPATGKSIKYRIFEAYADDGSNSQPKGVYGHFFLSGNFMNEKGENWDWNGMDVNLNNKSDLTKDMIRSNSAFAVSSVTTHSASAAFDKVLALAGASLRRDAVDARISGEAKNGTFTYSGSVLGGKGIIDSPADVGGWPKYNSTAAPLDSDGDGMPDSWEAAHGLNPSDASDGAALASDGSGYTNLEIYLNSLVCEIMSQGLEDASTPNYLSCNETVQDSAKLVKHGAGSSNQTVSKGAAISSFYFSWENASSVSVSGNLPKGVTYKIDNSAKTITFSGFVADAVGSYSAVVKTVGGINEAVYNLSFSVTAPAPANRRNFDFIVGVDGNFKQALDAAASATGRFYIFFPDGDYDIGSLTGDSNGKTIIKKSNLSLIGQSTKGVCLFNTSTEEGIGKTATIDFASSATNMYLQDMTLQNRAYVAANSSANRFVVVCDEGKKNIFKNVRLLSTQDTYYSRTDRSYWEGCEIHGTVDFICGYGDVLFNKSKIYLEYRVNSNVIAAPATSSSNKWGYVFLDCTIDGDAVNNNRYMLARSWQGEPRCVYINTKMNVLPVSTAWGDPMNVNPSLFAEYNSVDASGRLVDLSNRRSSFSINGSTVNINPVLKAADAAKYTVANVLAGSDSWAPDNDCRQMSAPKVIVDDNMITWAHNDSALCYFIFKNGKYLANVTDNFFSLPSDASTSDLFTVRSANMMGGLGAVSNSVSVAGIVPDVYTHFFYYGNGETSSSDGNEYKDMWTCSDPGFDAYSWNISGRSDKNILYGADVTYNGASYSTFKNSKDAQNTFYLPSDVRPVKAHFVGYSNSETATAVLTEIAGNSVSLPLSVSTASANYASSPSVISYKFDSQVCNSFSFTFSGAQACFFVILEVESCDCSATAVPDVKADSFGNSPVFDVNGRRVLLLTPGNVYIKGGQKFLIK